MKIALAQIRCEVGEVAANVRKIESYIERAAKAGCEVVLLPEMSDLGYDITVISEKAKTWNDEAFTTIAAAARSGGLHVICGLSERAGQSIYNSLAVISPRGELIGTYRKIHLFEPTGEKRCFAPGSDHTLIEIGGVLWGLTICYDLRFPELYRELECGGAQVLVNCTAWTMIRRAHWEVLTAARAIENQAFFIGVNRVGTDNGLEFCGTSLVLDPAGCEIVKASRDAEELIVAEIDLSSVQTSRQNFPGIRGKRTDLYRNKLSL